VVGIGISGYFGFLVEQLGINLPEWMLGAPGSDPDQPVAWSTCSHSCCAC
jgi:basic amino acid/polyamine antiporter, APA family